jgi:peptide/nickel transport system ATP-binding protein
MRGCSFSPRCRYADMRCRNEKPALVDDRPDHAYACFHPIRVAAGVGA